MKNKKTIEILSELYFPFSFYLLEDELQALQLVVDITTAAMIERTDFLEDPNVLKDDIYLYRKLYELALKRRSQISLEENCISLKEKASLYLFENLDFPLEKVALILDMTVIDLKQIISSSRTKVLHTIQSNAMQEYHAN
ncbi:MAG: hypothetical protein BM556_02775 [Bacteriovorax sp. MedPE-SWde]|nr:MAG: hypothetical protein BM556_02775 [Bacteriovorax sp. MedPE-SWde]